mmetsp:Transcript_92918/g.194207  ORF Transcript_92918/g.194207 Transcript_92918/m.194207 type:complete len:643 (+) Transcript_92918:374-2302(+)
MKYETQLCWVTQHYAMITMGSVAVFFPIAFVAFVAHATYQFPRKMTLGDTGFLHRFEFVFVRFKPEHRWMTLMYLIRNLAISLTPVIPDAFFQLLSLYLLFLMSCVANAWWTPWKLLSHSVLEVGVNCVFSTFIVIAMRFVEMPAQNVGIQLSLTLLLMSCLAFLAFSLKSLAAVLTDRYATRQKKYRLFLCHHKAAAGAIARLLKMVITECHLGRVFLDSDDLLDLRSLFDTVSEDVETLVVLCTQELLLRPYCLGEITTAYLDNVDTTPVNIAFKHPTSAFISHIKDSVDLQGLSEVGINAHHVKLALGWFRNLEAINYPPSSSVADVILLAQNLIPGRSMKSFSTDHIGKHQTGPTNLLVDIVLAADGSNFNALASATILQKFLSAREIRVATFHEIMISPGDIDFDTFSFHCMAVICTAGCWMDSEFMLSFRTATHMKASCLAIIADETFALPTPDIIRGIKERLEKSDPDEEADGVLETINFTFKLIALPLAVNGSWPTLQTQCATVCDRLIALLDLHGRSDMATQASSSSSRIGAAVALQKSFQRRTLQLSRMQLLQARSQVSGLGDSPTNTVGPNWFLKDSLDLRTFTNRHESEGECEDGGDVLFGCSASPQDFAKVWVDHTLSLDLQLVRATFV